MYEKFPYLTPTDFVRIFGGAVDYQTVIFLCRMGDIDCIRVNRRYLIPFDAVYRFSEKWGLSFEKAEIYFKT